MRASHIWMPVALAVLGAACTSIVGVHDIEFAADGGIGSDGSSSGDDATGAPDGSSGTGDAGCKAPKVSCDKACVEPSAFTADKNNCGGCGHSCAGGACAGSMCQAFEIATADLPNGIAVDMTSVYWTNTGATSGANGTVMKLSLNGGDPVTLASGQEAPYGIAVDAKNVYWTNFCCSGSNCTAAETPDAGCNVMQAQLDGTQPVTLASAQNLPAGIALDSANVYFGTYGGSVSFVPKGGGGGASVVTIGESTAVAGLAVCGLNLYWTDESSVYQLPLPASASSIPANTLSSANGSYSVACYDTSVFWASLVGTNAAGGLFEDVPGGPGGVEFAELQPGPDPSVLLDDTEVYANAVIAVDATAIYWVDTTGGSVNRVAKTGGTPIAIAPAQGHPFSIALYPPGQSSTATRVYWVNRSSGGGMGTGGVMEIAAP